MVPMRRIDQTGLVCVVSAALLLGACDRESASSKAIQAAADKMHQIEAETLTNADDPSMRRRVYNQVISELQPVANAGSAKENASANLLIAQSKLGLGHEPALRASLLERRCAELLTEIDTRRSQWVTLNAGAEADELYDPVDDLNRIRAEIAERDREIAELREQKNEVDAEIARLRELATAKLDAAGAERAEVGEIELRASRLSAIEARPLVEDAYERRRAADALEIEGLKIGAQADVFLPTRDELALDIGRVEAQRGMLEAESRAVQARADAGSARAAEARARAEALGNEIDSRVEALNELRRGALTNTYVEADELYASAASLARRAQNAYRERASITESKALNRLTDLHTAQSRGAARAARVIRTLAEAQPPLPDASLYANVADSYEQARDAAAETAAAHREGLTSALERAKLIEVEYEEPGFDDGYDDEPFDEPMSDGLDPWNLVDQQIEIVNSKDFGRLPELIHAETPDARTILEAQFSQLEAQTRLNDAVESQFGESLWPLLEEQLAATGLAAPGAMTLSREDFEVFADGESATITSPGPDGQPDENRAGVVDGRWMYLFGDPELSERGVTPEMAEIIGRYAPPAVEAIDGVIDQVYAGELNDAAAAFQAMQIALTPIQIEAAGELAPLMNPDGGP
jgi:hypothetical protein